MSNLNLSSRLRSRDDPFVEQAIACLEGRLNPEAHHGFAELLRASAPRRQQYALLCVQHQMMRKLTLAVASEQEAIAHFALDQDAANLLDEAMHEQQLACARKQKQAALAQAQTLAQHEEQDRRWRQLLVGAAGEPPQPIKHVVIPKAVFYGAIATIAAVLLLMILPMFESKPVSVAPIENLDAGPQLVQVATLVEQVDAKWLAPGSGEAPVPGDALLNQKIHLTSGLAKIRFNNDAEVILEAPCSIEPVSNKEIKITHGKLVGRCETTESKGFVVQTPSARIVDLGTEFGVEVDEHGAAQAHVFEGEIKLAASKNDQPVHLFQGQASQVNTAGTRVSTIETNELAFVRSEEFEANTKADQSPYYRWLAHSYKLRRDPDLVLHFDMNSRFNAAVVNSAASFEGGLQKVPGRFSRDAAVQIKHNDRAPRLNIPGEFASMTLAVWVRFYPDQGGRFRSLLMSDRWLTPGQVHWQINDKNQLQFGWRVSSANEREDQIIGVSTPLDEAMRSGGWRLLATAFDSQQKLITHYLDGRVVGQKRVESAIPMYFTVSQIGGWKSDPQDADRDRVLNGGIDDLFVWRRSLTSDEMRQLYEAGKP